MKQIKELYLAKFKTSDSFSHMDMTRQLSANILVEQDQNHIQDFSEKVKAFDEVIKLNSANTHTAALNEAITGVNDTWRGARAQVRAMLKYPVEAKRLAAEKAYAVFEKFGDISAMSQTAMYTAVTNMLEELKALPEEELTLIDLQIWIDQLDAYLTKYTSARLSQTAEAEGRVGIVAEKRTAAEKAYDALVFRINAGAGYNGDEPYAVFIDNLNGLIEKMHTMYAARQTNNAKKEEEEDGNDPAVPDLPVE